VDRTPKMLFDRLAGAKAASFIRTLGS